MRASAGLLVLLTACNSFLNVPPPPPPPPGSPMLVLVKNFTNPVYLTAPRADSSRLFVVEKDGKIRIVRHDTLLARSFLDLTGKITSDGERGLLSLAFHPAYATNGRFYVYFTNPDGDIRIVRYNVSSDPDSADPATADTVIKIVHQLAANHNGGQLQFGLDSMLYAGTGDGGGGGDPDSNGQNKHALLAKLLRLNVNGATGYTIPPDNPFASDTSGAPEVFAYGLRNPWRFSFDRQTGDLYIADVGQNTYEEVDIAAAPGRGNGANYGWNVMEGQHCYPPPGTGCTTTGLIQPFLEYVHSLGACSITGGYVYRGSVDVLKGNYFYADYCAGFVRSFRFTGTGITTQLDWSSFISPGGSVSSFGEDAAGELYIMTLNGGVYKIVASP